jgi:hypothetical protein
MDVPTLLAHGPRGVIAGRYDTRKRTLTRGAEAHQRSHTRQRRRFPRLWRLSTQSEILFVTTHEFDSGRHLSEVLGLAINPYTPHFSLAA